MRSFTDEKNRAWTFEINVPSNSRVKALAGVNLFEFAEKNLAARFINDPELLVNTIYALCKPDLDNAGISDEEFGKAMVGDAIDRATDALMEAVNDFFPKSRRELIRKAVGKTISFRDKAAAKIGAEIDAIDVDAVVSEMLKNFSTSLPGSSESIPLQ